MPKDYARSSKKKKSSGRSQKAVAVRSRSKVWPIVYISLGILLSYIYQHPQQSQQQFSHGISSVAAYYQGVIAAHHSRSTPAVAPKAYAHHSVARNLPSESEQSRPELQFYDLLKHAKDMVTTKGTAAQDSYEIQVGAFMKKTSCQHLAEHLKSEGFLARTRDFYRNDQDYCRVMVGSYATLGQAYEAKNKLYALGIVGVLRQKIVNE